MPREIGPDETVTTAIVRAVAERTGRDPMALACLGGVVDPDALEGLFDGPPGNGVESLTLVYEGRRVTVDADGVTVEDVA